MPEKPKLIAEFKECPICHCTETISQKATKHLKEAGRLPEDSFTYLSHQQIPLTDPRVAIMVETLVVFYDICAMCGFPYCTRALTALGKVIIQQMPGQPTLGSKPV